MAEEHPPSPLHRGGPFASGDRGSSPRYVFTDNKDDHAKNFSFICHEGRWHLAPAYDLTPVPEGYHGEHATSVNGNGKPTIDDMLIVGESIRIHKKHGMEIIDFVREHCKEILSKDYLS